MTIRVRALVDGLSAPEIAIQMDLCGATVRFWLKRFNERSLLGLEEDMRLGRPPTYSAEERSAVIAAALSRPAELDLPFASWTLDRLVVHLGEQGIGMRRSRERWPASSRQRFGFDKWCLCRLSSCAAVGASRREGVARLE